MNRIVVIIHCDGSSVRLVKDNMGTDVSINDLENFLETTIKEGYRVDDGSHCSTCNVPPVGDDCLFGSILMVIQAKYPKSVTWE